MLKNCDSLKSNENKKLYILLGKLRLLQFIHFYSIRKDAAAYQESLQRLREEKKTVNTVDAVQETTTTEKVPNKINNTSVETQSAKPVRRPSQTLLVKPKVNLNSKYIYSVV